MHDGRRYLVTGATGMVGAALTRRLVDEGARVRILVRDASRLGLVGEAADRVERVVGDLAAPDTLAPAFEGVTHVFHAAAALGSGRPSDRALLHAVNVAGTGAVVDAARRAGVVRLAHVSSIAALGRVPGVGEVDERAEWTPSPLNTPYATSKHLAELEVHRGIAEGLDAVMVNPALVFGEAHAGENTRKIVEEVRDGRLVGTPPGGTGVVDVLDVVDGLVRAMERGGTGERYVLVAENLLWRDLLATLAAAFGVTPPRRAVPMGLARVLALGSEAVARVTGQAPLLTRERVRQMGERYRYRPDKAVRDLGMTFRPFAETAARLARSLDPSRPR